MDFDPKFTSDGSGYGSGHGWHCNFHFGYGLDIINEEAENEKSCVQVLQLLLAKADAEILDLEDELAILQCQLKCTKLDCKKDPYEQCCGVFERKIDCLLSSIESLRNGNGLIRHHQNVTMELKKPAERVCDIIYASIMPQIAEFDKDIRVFGPVSTSEGNSRSNALQHGESGKCTRLKRGHGGTSTVSAKKELVVKVEEDYNDLDAPLNSYNYKIQNHAIIISNRKKSSSSSMPKPEGKLISPLILEEVVKNEPLSDAESSGRSGSPFKVQKIQHLHPEMIGIEDNMIYANPFQAKSQLQATRIQGCHTEPRKVNIPTRNVFVTRGREMRARSSQLTEAESPAYGLGNLKLSLFRDPGFLNKLTKPQLKEILRQNKISGLSNATKKKIIEELTKRLHS